MKRANPVLATSLVASAIILASCGIGATSTATSVPAAEAGSLPTEAVAIVQKFRVGQVADLGGIDNQFLNATAYKGMQDAIAQLGIEGKYVESQRESDRAKNIQQLLSEDMDLIIVTGSQLGVDTAIAAKAYPDRNFAIVEYTYPDCEQGMIEGRDCGSATQLPNVRSITFQTDQAAFLAGYLAAGMTKTDMVGTYGGDNIPSVTIFMKGFEQGVKYYNMVHGTGVEVKGGLSEPSGGLFTGNFDSADDGRAYAEALILEGVDILMPVAGAAGLGSAAVCKETGLCLIIGVNTDWFNSAPEYQEVELTSVIKKFDVAVYDTIKDAMDGMFTGGEVVYTMKEGGVDIAPFHELDDRVPASLKAEIEALRQQLINDSLDLNSAASQD